MAVSASIGARKTIEKICLRAYQGVGLRSTQQGTDDAQWKDDFAFAKDMLDSIVNELAVYGVDAHAIAFETINVTSDDVSGEVYKYPLSANALDVVGDGVWIDASHTDLERADGETIIKMITAQQWHELSSHGATGTPHMAYTNRNATPIEVWVWQIPTEAGAMRFPVQRKLSDTDDGSATLDLEEYWLEYIYTALQLKLARAKVLPISVQQSLLGESRMRLEYAKGKSNQRPAPMAVLNHPTGWSR